MDFDIDAVLDQLEKTLNQSDLEEKPAEQIVETTSPPPSPRPKRTADELLLLDLDPFGNTEGNIQHEDGDQLERLKQDLQELYASSVIVDPPATDASTLADLAGLQEEFASVTLPVAVDHLEMEVREEIMQHTHDQQTSSVSTANATNLADGTDDDRPEAIQLSDLPNGDEGEVDAQEEHQQPPPTESVTDDESKPVDHEPSAMLPSPVLHSVDSIVNAPSGSDFTDHLGHARPDVEIEPLQTSSELLFTACEDDQEDGETEEEPAPLSFEPTADDLPATSISDLTASVTPLQDFDLVKNMLSEIFDRPEEELLDEPIPSAASVEQPEPDLTPSDMTTPSALFTTNNEDFRFLDEMLASIDVSDADIHQLTPAEIDRVDNLLKDIVNAQQMDSQPVPGTDEVVPEPLVPVERPPSPPPEACALPAAAAAPVDEELLRVEHEWSKLTEEQKRLGSVAPDWVSDDLAPTCMKCTAKFSITRRRHHCRACGKVFCSTCCWQKVKLIHDDSKEDRACNDCVKTINEVEYLWNYMRNNQKPRSSVLRKRTGASVSAAATGTTAAAGRQGSEHKKSVTFDDGVKPGDQTSPTAAAVAAASNIMSTFRARMNETDLDQAAIFKSESFTPEELPAILGRLTDADEPPVEFRLQNNLLVVSKIVDNFDCYLTRNQRRCWIFSTRGLCAVAQDELIFVVDEEISRASEIIADLLNHIHQIYNDATKGSFVRHLGLSLSANPSTFLGSSTAAGFLYTTDPTSRHSLFPEAPFLFGILLHRLELPTAQCFPMRLLLRLGYEYQSFPWPSFSVLQRDAMFSDTQNTIMSLLCDFRSFTYVLPTVRGVAISIGSQGSATIRMPRNRHDDILKALEQSSPHALSFGIVNVNRQMHSKHLVTVQNTADQQYETRVFSSTDMNNEQITIGGNFLVINASLRSRDSPSSSPLDTHGSGSFSSNNNLNAKVNAIEDGIMLQIDGDALKVLKQCLRERKDYAILARARPMISEEPVDGNVVKRTSSEQLVEFLWVDDDNETNRGVRSPIDHFPMDGIRNSRIHYTGQCAPQFRLRWTDLFFVECHLNSTESLDPTRLADLLAKAFTQALTPVFEMLVEAKCRKLALRVTIDRENASYLAGANGEQLSPFFLSQLDEHMIPIVMKASDTLPRAAPTLVLELVFYLLD